METSWRAVIIGIIVIAIIIAVGVKYFNLNPGIGIVGAIGGGGAVIMAHRLKNKTPKKP